MKHIQMGHKDPSKVPKNPGLPGSAVPSRPPAATQAEDRFCAYCGASRLKSSRRCVICGTVVGQEPSISPFSHAGESGWGGGMGTPAHMRIGRRRIAIAALLMIFLFILSGTGVAAFEYLSYQNMLSQYTAHDAAVYVTAQGALKINIAALPEPALISGQYTAAQGAPLAAAASPANRFLAYLNDRERAAARDWKGRLFLLDLVRLGGDDPGEGLLIREDVVDFRFLPRGDRLLYLTEEGALYLCNFAELKDPFSVGKRTESLLLDTGVKGIGESIGRYLLYYKGDRADTRSWAENLSSETGSPLDLYLINYEDAAATPLPVGEGVYRVEDSTREYERLIYTKRTRSLPLAIYDVFVFQRRDGISAQIARDARHVVDASAQNGAVIALSPSEEVLTFKDLIEDDLLLEDQSRTEPQLADYGLDLDFAELEQMDPAVVDERYDRYDAAFVLYQEKLNRDQLRKSLRAELRSFMEDHYLSFGLYYADGSSTRKLAENIYNRGAVETLAWADAETGSAVAVSGDRGGLKKLYMSELTDNRVLELIRENFDILRHLSTHMDDNLLRLDLGGEPRLIFDVSGRLLGNIFVPASGAGLYFTSTPPEASGGILYYTSLAEDDTGAIVHVDEDVTVGLGEAVGLNEGFVYLKHTRGNATLRDICIVNAGSTKPLASGVEPIGAALAGEGGGIISFLRVPDGQTAPVLYLYEEQERFIAQSVRGLGLYRPQLLYLTRGLSASRASLYLYRDNEAVLLDENVTAVTYLGLPE